MIDAQCLVWPGYSGAPQRVYLVKLVDDVRDELQATGNGTLGAFQLMRLQQWTSEGVLPVTIFRKLVHEWRTGRHLSSAIESVAYQVDIGITFKGLEQLPVRLQLLDLLRYKAPAFSEGAQRRASRFLGDTGPSDPQRWQTPYQDDIHALIFVHENQTAGFLSFESSVTLALGHAVDPEPASLLPGLWIETSTVLGEKGEIHFDMVDGVSNPRFYCPYDPQPSAKTPKTPNIHKLGELLLGHERDDGSNAWLVPGAQPQPSGYRDPRPIPERAVYSEFFANGSFGAFRKMEQHVGKFNTYLEENAPSVPGNWPPEYQKAWLKAKMLGRWESGEVMKPDHALLQDCNRLEVDVRNRMSLGYQSPGADDFTFKDDPDGFGCPYGAHIRRMNPRNDPVVPFLKRPLLRRGVPYGTKEGPHEKGLLGLFLCASLEEQFEHLLGAWADNNPMGLPLGTTGKDPIIGNHEPYGGAFEVPIRGRAGPLLFKTLGAFVQTRGTVYLFFPSVSALEKIAKGNALIPSTVFMQVPAT